MVKSRIKLLISIALVGGAITPGSSVHAYWAGPWAGPWGGPMHRPGYPYAGYDAARERTYERQSEMNDHKAAMQSVARMLSGRSTFDRAKAVGLVRAIEASAGENLTQMFKPGDSRRSPLSRARVDDMDTFSANAEALKAAAGELADELEKEPGAEDVMTGQAMSPGWNRSMRRGMGGPYGSGRSKGGGHNRCVRCFHKTYGDLQQLP